MSSDLMEMISNIVDNNIVNRHSYFQLKYFVILREPTHQARMWKCISELKSRKDSIEAYQIQIEELEDCIKLKDLEINKLYHQDHKVLDIKKRQELREKLKLDKKLEELKRGLKEAEEEANFFVIFYKDLEKSENLKPFDDLESQTEMWNSKLTEQMKVRLLLGLPLNYELINTILALGNNVPIKVELMNTLNRLEKDKNGKSIDVSRTKGHENLSLQCEEQCGD